MNCRCKDNEEDCNYITIKFRSYGKTYEISTDSFSSAEDMAEFIDHALKLIGFDFLQCVRKE